MVNWRKIAKQTSVIGNDENFLDFIKVIETFVSKILSFAMVIIILVGVFDLTIYMFQNLDETPLGFFNKVLLEVFGLFLNILIALELLENITAYLKKHVVQVELVIVTSLIAVARKIIIFDFAKSTGIDLMGLALAIFALSISYWLIRRLNIKPSEH
ncbi:MAG TPA: phosphate-starvation-inducible PsiE family protein [Leptolyngbyaceae cyanobacterium]